MLDPARRPVPVGVPGELYVGGAGVARGYLNRPELTAERFVREPVRRAGRGCTARATGCGGWRTGRWSTWAALDEQVKIRGFRIELGEIEAALRRSARRRATAPSSCARTRPATGGWWRTWWAKRRRDGAARRTCGRSLPEYMVPAAFVVAGRAAADRRTASWTARRCRRRSTRPAEERYVAPRTPAEEVLAGIWAEVLKVERVGVHDNFFALGGHSLLAVTLVERMRRRGVHADVRALFITPTVAELAAAVGGAVPRCRSRRTGSRPAARPSRRTCSRWWS